MPSKTFPNEELVPDKQKNSGKNCVIVASSLHNVMEKSIVQSMTKEGVKVTVESPEGIEYYNRNMGGINRFDQIHSCYSISWKS